MGVWLRRLGWFLALGAALGIAYALNRPERWDAWRTFLVAPSPRRFPVRGIDVSHHQGPIDWAQVRASGQHFAFIKATEGVDFRDTRFQENWRGARAHGVEPGAYHFFTFCSPGVGQAENFLGVALAAAPSLPLAVDVEFTGNCVGWQSLDAVRRELLAFVGHVHEHAGHAPLLYTTEDLWHLLVPPELRGHRYWIRSLWGEPREGLGWQFWQYSDTGSVPGIRGAVDLNVFAGSRADWIALLAGEGGGD